MWGQAMNDNIHGNMADGTNPSTGLKGRVGAGGENGADAQRLASRRRLLLRGIGKGSALLAATVPIKTLASTASVTANGQICSASGTQSAAHSQATNLPTCGGKSPGYFMKASHWPNSPATTYTVGIKTFNQNTSFRTVFGGGLDVSMLAIMNTIPHNEDEFHWIPALLNGFKPPSGYVFPYSASEVLALYAGPKRADALTFFKSFMETI